MRRKKDCGMTQHASRQMRCKRCKARQPHKVYKGDMRPDAKRPDRRDFDERPVKYVCRQCGKITNSVECPNLLADMFSI